MEKVAVFPVPDWACAMTSRPLEIMSYKRKSRLMIHKLTADNGQDGALLDGGWALKIVGVDT